MDPDLLKFFVLPLVHLILPVIGCVLSCHERHYFFAQAIKRGFNSGNLHSVLIHLAGCTLHSAEEAGGSDASNADQQRPNPRGDALALIGAVVGHRLAIGKTMPAKISSAL